MNRNYSQQMSSRLRSCVVERMRVVAHEPIVPGSIFCEMTCRIEWAMLMQWEDAAVSFFAE